MDGQQNRRARRQKIGWIGGLLVLVVIVGAVAGVRGSVAARDNQAPNTITAELIGQVLNPSPAVGAQYGYVSYLKGVEASAITAPGMTHDAERAVGAAYLL